MLGRGHVCMWVFGEGVGAAFVAKMTMVPCAGGKELSLPRVSSVRSYRPSMVVPALPPPQPMVLAFHHL